jgi:hypothetical protein
MGAGPGLGGWRPSGLFLGTIALESIQSSGWPCRARVSSLRLLMHRPH